MSQVTGYDISYKKCSGSSFFRNKIVTYWHTSCILVCDPDGIEPLNRHEIKVRPRPESLNTEWTSITIYVDWLCRFPGCDRNRRKRQDCEGSYSAFCTPLHAESFNATYCLFRECTVKRCKKHNFCSKQHVTDATTSGFCGLVKLDDECKEYHNLTKLFLKTWSSEKGRVPRILSVVEIVNPSMQNRFDKYCASLPWWYQTVEQYYHGTQLKCDMLDYLEPCFSATCGICGIAKRGFDPKRISSNAWQRFGKGFYLAPNSSKAYEYPLAGRNQSADLYYRCVLVCDVAPGCKYTLYSNAPGMKRPPSGYHSIHGKAKWLWFKVSPHLNYDELVVFEAVAIRPHFILFCENF